ncbi:MAG: FHA domain-containing protein [Deltaproteobacteria bacterium]|nr:FHA domain-containing protein [Deltaproteobacteria bacterium]
MPRLLWRDAQGIEGSLDLASTEIKVGRAMDCAIRTDDAMVSRHHSRIFWGGGGYVLEDLSSANGVYFQEQRVQSHLFKHGDAVRCGSLWLRYVDTGAAAAATPAAAAPATPMMQHPGMGAIAPAGQTGHVSAVSPAAVAAAMPSPQPQPPPVAAESDAEIRVLRRRLEQLQTELRVYRSNKFNQDTARKMEDLEADLSAMEIERDLLKSRMERAEHQVVSEAGSVKVKRALEIAAATQETSASLNDLLSSLRIEVMAAEGEFEQFSNQLPRASFELIRQSLKEAQGHCDQARELLRKLREGVE